MKKKKRTIILLLTALVLSILAAGAYAIWNIKINDITVIGNTIYDREEIISYIFPNENDLHTIYSMWKQNSKEHIEIPFIKSYEVNITGMNSAEIVVYEKGIIGALKYMGTYLYFDSDGYIVDTSTMILDNVVAIDGINFDYFVLNDRLPVKDDNIFGSILVLSRSITSEKLGVTRIYLDSAMNITVYLGEIKAFMGEGKNLEKKVHLLKDILPSIEGMKGTLYLNYSATVLDTKEYFFKEEKEKEEEESSSENPSTDETLVDNSDIISQETTEEESHTEGIPVMIIDEDTGEVIIKWTEATSEEETTERTTEETTDEENDETTEESDEASSEETTEETVESSGEDDIETESSDSESQSVEPIESSPVDVETPQGMPTGGATETVVDPDTGIVTDVATGYQVDPSTGCLIEPNSGYLIDSSTGYLIEPETGKLIDPITGFPVDIGTGCLVDPSTGFLIDPYTGYLLDPVTGYPIDPSTGYLIDPSTKQLIDPSTGELINPI